MSATVNLNGGAYAAIARDAWGATMPDWVAILAEECDRTSAAAVCARIKYSPPVLSEVLRGKYKGALGKVEAKVRGAFMGATVDCPVLGEIGRDHCLEEQKRRHIGTSAIRTKLTRACPRCVHARIEKEAAHV